MILLAGPLGGLIATGTPEIWAQDTSPSYRASIPLTVGDITDIQTSLREDGVATTVGDRVENAIAEATDSAGCHLRRGGLDRARRALDDGDADRAATLTEAYLQYAEDADCTGPEAADNAPSADDRRKARLLAANAHLKNDAPDRTVGVLEGVDADETPIPDYARWLDALAHEALDDHDHAADLYAEIYADEQTPLKFRARARQAVALVEAGRYEESLPALDEMLDLFPDYPRRDQLLFQRARALEELGRLEDAAATYQKTWYEFPHKPTGDRALARMELLKRRGIRVDSLSREKLFRRFRQLRIYRQWDLAETYLTRLLDHESTPGGHSAFEHRLQMQLAINAFEPKQNQKALDHLQALRDDYRAGYTRGIRSHIVDKYMARTLARMGRFDEALAAMKRRLDRYGRQTRRRKLIEFFREHGRYEKAFQIADSSYSSWRKRRWPYGWLLYKTGRFDDATDHFETYARARNDRPRAKGLYWAARAHERAGRPEEARALFEEVSREFTRGYYGIQAVNRLRDLRQRDAIDGTFAKQTGSVLDSGDDVFAAFNNATQAMNRQGESTRVDSSMVPRVPSDDEGTPIQSIRSDDCLSAPSGTSELCQMMAGDVPEETADAIERALSPFGLQKTPTFEQVGRDAPTASASTDDMPESIIDPSGQTDPVATPNRISYPTQGRIYWEGRHNSQVAFAQFGQGEPIGPMPTPNAYGNSDHVGGLDRAVAQISDRFPDLVRADWLYDIGLTKHARTVARDVALEFRGLSRRSRPADGRPHELPYKRWTYLIDYRKYGRKGMWGYDGDDVLRFPVPETSHARRELADRQQTIWDTRDDTRPALVSALKEVGDYHLVRKFTLEEGDWINSPPTPATRDKWMQAYPRAFPRKVMAESREHGINPYLIWSLMTVESGYNPDSISPAKAIGLLQVIPRTGVKVATWIGDDDFGPYDLTDEEVAIEQGVSYFSSLVRKFRGQELLAFAGYNGGPHRVSAWMEKRGSMPLDEFVEEVPFTQARNYVKKVTRFLGLYLRLYEGTNSLYVGQNIDGDYKHYPNF